MVYIMYGSLSHSLPRTSKAIQWLLAAFVAGLLVGIKE